MSLNHKQKNYIKKNVRSKSLDEIASTLDISKEDIIDYLKKRWGDEKFEKFQKGVVKPLAPQDTKKDGSFMKDHGVYLSILIMLVLITYANSFNNAFVSDDIAEIFQNPNVGNFSYIFTHPFGFIRIILNWLAFHIGGLNPFFFRSFNYLFHIGNVLLIYVILNFIHSKRVAFFASSAFAVHPAISEAVVWISGGTYPQYAFFFLLSFWLYLKSKTNIKFYWLSVIVFSFTLMSHPVMPLGLFTVFLLIEFCFGNIKKNWVRAVPYFLLAITYVFINIGALPERETTLQSVHYQERGVDNPLIQIPIAVSSYLELIFWPKVLTLYHSELAFGAINFSIRAAISILVVLFILVNFKRNEQSSSTSKAIFFWGSFALISLAPTLTPFRFNWIVAERYLYLPSLGIFTLLALGLNQLLVKFLKYKYIIYLTFAIILVILGVRTIFRNIDWHSEDNLWIATGKTSPSSPNTHNNLGDVYGRQGNKQRALQEFQTAIVLKPNYGDAYHNLANTYRELGQMEKALENYQKAIEFNPNLWQSYQNIAALYFQNKQYDKTLEYIQKAIEINPKNINLRTNLGILYLVAGEKEKAKEVFNLVLSADPQNQLARQGLIEASK